MVGASAVATGWTVRHSHVRVVATGDHRLDPSRLGDHTDRLYRVAWGLCGSREEAEDLVQETFANVLAKPRLIKADNDIGYLMRVLRNTFVSTRRSAARRLQTTSHAETLDLIEDRCAVRPEDRLEYADLYKLIAALPGAFRDALVAVDVGGLSYREAAHVLGIREATLTSRLHRARQRIAAELAPAGLS